MKRICCSLALFILFQGLNRALRYTYEIYYIYEIYIYIYIFFFFWIICQLITTKMLVSDLLSLHTFFIFDSKQTLLLEYFLRTILLFTKQTSQKMLPSSKSRDVVDTIAICKHNFIEEHSVFYDMNIIYKHHFFK